MPRCKTCDAPIVWAYTENMKRVPLDGGKPLLVAIKVGHDGPTPIVRFVKARMNHFATCPDAAEHRKEKKADGRRDNSQAQ